MGAVLDEDAKILNESGAIIDIARRAMDAYQPHLALAEIFRVVAEANRYFAGQEPGPRRRPTRSAWRRFFT